MTRLLDKYARDCARGVRVPDAEVYEFDLTKGWEESCNSKIIDQAVAMTIENLKVRTLLKLRV